MEKEEFKIKAAGNVYTIKTALPVGPDPVDHEVWHNNTLLFVINPKLNESDEPAWALTREFVGSDIDKSLVQEIGEAIERHYL